MLCVKYQKKLLQSALKTGFQANYYKYNKVSLKKKLINLAMKQLKSLH